MPVAAVRVRGLRDLQAAFKVAGKAEQRELRDALADAGEPVRRSAELLALGTISRIGFDWSQMRVGVTSRVVYVAPRQRSRSGNPRRKRPNLAGLLLGRAMEPALEANRTEVDRRVGVALDTVGRAWEHA